MPANLNRDASQATTDSGFVSSPASIRFSSADLGMVESPAQVHFDSSSTKTASSPTSQVSSPGAEGMPESIPAVWTHHPREVGHGYGTPERQKTSMLTHYDHLVPPDHDWRTLVLCFDGTGDQFDSDNSNIVKFHSLLKKNDRNHQMVYYQAGIGTYTIPQIATPGMAAFQKTIDEMIAWSLDAHVMAGYEFLMENYIGGDKICIFGFSRGAYTARALAGMIHKVGLLPSGNHQQVPFAYKMYSQDDEIGWKQSNAFKKAFSVDVDIEFVGVWDTVNSVGIIPQRLPFTSSNTAIRYFRQALALDERRVRFQPNQFSRASAKEHSLGIPATERPRTQHVEKPKHEIHDHHSEEEKKHLQKRNKKLKELEFEYNSRSHQITDHLEVWFAGCHCDVGGGSVKNGVRHSLARIPLRWMIRQTFLCQVGILFDADLLKTVGLHADMLFPTVQPRPFPKTEPPPHVDYQRLLTELAEGEHHNLTHDQDPMNADEEEEDLADALSPMYDQLSLSWPWWILEVLPQKVRFEKSDNSWQRYFSVNLGQGRLIRHQETHGVKIHRTVRLRRDAHGLRDGPYKPKARFTVEPEWVD